MNKLAVASLVLGILTPVLLLPGLLGLIFGIIALAQIAQRRERGKGLAIGGIVVTVVWLLVGGALLVAAVLARVDGDGDSTRLRGTDVAVGDCLETVPDDGFFTSLPTVPCDQPHEGEVYGAFDLEDGDFPGDDSVVEQAADGCLDMLETDHPDAYDDPDLDVLYLHPTEATWRLGDREVVCAVYFLDGQRTGSVLE